MKKIISMMAFAILINSGKSLGQSTYRPALQKGSVLTNGNLALSFGTAKSDYRSQQQASSMKTESGYSSMSLSPKVGVLIMNGVMVGLAFDLNSMTMKDDTDDSKSTTRQYTIGPVIRYYAPGGFFMHADIAVGKNVEKYGSESMEDTNDTKVNKWQLGIGYAIFINPHIAIEPNLIYRNSTSKWENDYGKFEGSLGEFVVGVGFSIFLHKKD